MNVKRDEMENEGTVAATAATAATAAAPFHSMAYLHRLAGSPAILPTLALPLAPARHRLLLWLTSPHLPSFCAYSPTDKPIGGAYTYKHARNSMHTAMRLRCVCARAFS